MKGLSPPGMGLPPYLCHLLAASLLFLILSHGGDIFHPKVHMMRKLSVFWHKVQRWFTNCFTCTTTDILTIEACLPPLDVLVAYKRHLANLWVLCSPPEINPTTAWLAPSVQTPSLLPHAPDPRALLAQNAGSQLPLPWLQPLPLTKNRAHLPLDAIPHSMLFLLGPDGLAALPVTSRHLLAEAYRERPEGCTYPEPKRRCCDLLMEEWKAGAPAPERYPYPPSLKPHPFMALNKFDSGRLNQMRSGKSYLRTHLSWDNDNPMTCPRCKESPESFEHGILSCTAIEPAMNRHLQAVTDLGPDAPVWSSAPLLTALSRFIKSTRTTFPPGMFSGPTSGASFASSLLSNVVSFGYFMSSQES